MRVGQARYHAAASQVNRFAARREHLARRRILAHVENALISYGDRCSERRFGIQRMDTSIEQNEIRLHAIPP